MFVLLSQFLEASMEVLLGEVFHIFSYLKAHNISSFPFAPESFEIDMSRFTQTDFPAHRSLSLQTCPILRRTRTISPGPWTWTMMIVGEEALGTASCSDIVFKTPEHLGCIYSCT
jgi:hypothetical protein